MAKLDYVASVGADDERRLSIQHEVFSEGTKNFLARLDVSPGKKVLVIGCGAGDETLMIANLVGSEGVVVAIDISSEQLAIAEKKVRGSNLENIVLKKINLMDLAEDVDNALGLNSAFDVVYCRMVISHLSDRDQALSNMKQCAKVGGVVACEEPIVNSCYSTPSSTAFMRHIEFLCEFITRNGGDPSFGATAKESFEKVGLSDVHESFFQPVITEKELKECVVLSARSCKDKYIAQGLVTEEEMDNIIAKIDTDLSDDSTVLTQCRMVQVSGRK